MGENSWILWMIIPFLFFMMAGRGSGQWGCAPRSRRRSHSRKSEEISRLKQELEYEIYYCCHVNGALGV